MTRVRKTACLVVSSFFLIAVTAGIFLYFGKSYYPPLPFDGVSKHEVVKKLEASNGKLVLLAEGEKANWYGCKGNARDTRQALQILMRERNLTFIEQLGAAYLFEDSENNGVVVESEQWTGRYRLFEVPN